MTGTDEPRDEAVEKELAGVPEELLDKGGEGDGHSLDDALASLRGDLERAQQDMLYARAEAQNVRRRMEKDVADARAYAATGFARDILSVADNLSRALDHVPEGMRDDLEKAQQEMLYAKAEVQNVRRRLEKDIQDARTYAATGFARDILSVADNLARALEHVPEGMREDEKFKGFLAGIEATQRELDKVFGLHGISRIASQGLPLDPNQHQAMLEIPTNEAEPGTVVQEMQAGYMIKDRLLRPAMVGVAKKPG